MNSEHPTTTLTTAERAVLSWFAAQPEAVDLNVMFDSVAPKPAGVDTPEARDHERKVAALYDAATFAYRAGLMRVARLGNSYDRTTLWEITDVGREALATTTEERP